ALTGSICRCRMENNRMCGIKVSGMRAQPTLEENVCEGNYRSGIIYSAGAGGVARHNHCVGNKTHGIEVFTSKPTLEENVCEGNKQVGIAYFGSVGGAARHNYCVANEQNGILVSEQAQ